MSAQMGALKLCQCAKRPDESGRGRQKCLRHELHRLLLLS